MRIGVVGAGLAGLAAAAFLARDGHAVEILERAPEPHPLGAGLLLQPPGTAILGRLGALMPLEASAARIARLDSRTSGGRTLLDLHYAALGPGIHGLGLTRPAIWSALMEAAARSGARMRPGTAVAGIEEADGTADIAVEGGRNRRYDLAVVATGAHSALRRTGPRHRSVPYPWGCLWATVPLPATWPLDVLQQRCTGTRVMAGVLPTGLQNGRQVAALYWSIRNDRIGAWHSAALSAWREEVARAWPEAGALVGDLPREEIRHATYRDVWANPPHRGPVVVIGDAAHGTSPQLGQGTTQALRDAETLAAALRHPGSLADRLAAYWAERRASTRYYRLASRFLTPAFQSGIPLLGPARDLLAGPVGAIPYVRRQSLLTLAGAKTGLLGADLAWRVPGDQGLETVPR